MDLYRINTLALDGKEVVSVEGETLPVYAANWLEEEGFTINRRNINVY